MFIHISPIEEKLFYRVQLRFFWEVGTFGKLEVRITKGKLLSSILLNSP